MKKAGLKIKSQRGATLMLALLMFLICAVLGSVVLMAGTAAAGRMSQLSKMEQRYYAVTSAANLLREKLCTEDSVELVFTRELTSVGGADPVAGNWQIKGTTDFTGKELLVRLSRVALTRDGDVIEESLTNPVTISQSDWDCLLKDEDLPEVFFTQENNKSIALSASGKESLAVVVEASFNPDQTVLLKISNKDGEKYTLNMTLIPDLSRSLSKTTSMSVSGSVETVTTTETVTASIRWILSNIEIDGGGSST